MGERGIRGVSYIRTVTERISLFPLVLESSCE